MDTDRQRLQPSFEALRDSGFSDESWMHASGWAQLSSERRTISCVLLGLASPGALLEALPALRDFLTVVGYPWEVVAIDVRETAEVGQVRSQWTEARGVRRIALPSGTSAAQLLTVSLQAARGDVVLLVGERGFASLGLIPMSATRLKEAMLAIRSKLQATPSAVHPGAADAMAAERAAIALWEDVTLLDQRSVDLLLSDR
jgi:hypothetical protein